ncbi:hypothetical protein PHISCL_06944 [Aspergillus sclerotialis]|uniref:Uncharacterized protein n=1 Tax=Aspergillus sclerotialis TaxID=2070753 RepID=A0A3A2ZEG2_9EURO|nr:hypothetical protein PHISCL_06944 [Aspergillus sclerotialis]
MDLPRPSDPIPIPASVTTQQSFIEPNSPPGKHDGLRIAPQATVEETSPNETGSEAPHTAPVVPGDSELKITQCDTSYPTPLVSGNAESMPPPSNDHDTLVYIDPPVNCFSPSELSYPISLVPHRVHSGSLLNTGSTYFQKFFSPTYQFRVVKRRGLAGRLPEGIKYVIDLTPPTIEDEAVITVMALSCPTGVRSWANKRTRFNLPPACVGGKDEYEPVEISTPLEPSQKPAALPVEYSASRHRVAIEQILHVLEGRQVKLDTPCKLYTFWSLANLFEVASTPRICDLILAWFYESTNVRFIEINPEITYRVACGIKCSSLCRTAFSILVGEEAMLLLAQTGKSKTIKRPTTTLHGRVRDSLDDIETQRIEYASKSFMDYIVGRFVYLAGTEMPWIAELAEYQKILNCPPLSGSELSTVSTFISTLKNLIRGYIYWHFDKTNLTWVPEPLPTVYDDYPPSSFRSSYGEMRYIERLMSRTFWNTLKNNEWLSMDWSRPGRGVPMHCSIAEFGELPALQNETGAKIIYVHDENIIMKASRLNDILMKNSDPSSEAKAHLDISILFSQIQAYIATFASDIAYPPQAADLPDLLTDTLTCLTENEYKFLPLWAGGNDDGTGGAYTDQGIPNLETGGFSAPGPGISTGSAAPSDASYAVLTSDYENTEQAASHRATQSHQTELMSMDSVARSLDDVNVDGEYDADVPSSDRTTEDDAPSLAFSDGSDSEFAQGGGISDGDEGDDSSVTIGERDSISDFLDDEDDALELDLEGGYDVDNDDGDDDDSTGDVERFI